MVALMALMSLLALFALAAAPSIQQQTQREREKEAMFRGEQVAEAIRSYYRYRGGQGPNSLPTDIDQLLEGIQIPGRTKKLQILRAEAAVDPLSEEGEWRRIPPTSDEFRRFVQSLMEYSGGVAPQPRREFASMAGLIPQLTTVLNTGSDEEPPGGDKTLEDTDGPFIGVASRSQRSSVITYYGIERHDEWIFTPMFR
jgi:type II secretory pathway pseudopilin PulG